MLPHLRNRIECICLLALAYFALGRLGLLLPAYGPHITLVWLPTGVAVGAFLTRGFGCWPGVFIGALAVYLAGGISWPLALAIAGGNTLGPLATAWLLQRSGFHLAFDRKRDILLLAVAAGVAMAVSASIGVLSLARVGLDPAARTIGWFVWWAGDATGVISAAPLVLALARREASIYRSRRLEFVAWLCATVAVVWLVFVKNHGADGYGWPVTVVTLPMVAWAALRYGTGGTSIALIVTSVGAAYGTAAGGGPFFRADPVEGLAVLWIYMATTAVLGWLILALQSTSVHAAAVRRVFERAMADVSLGVVLAGPDRRMTYVNEGFTRVTGYAAEESLGKSCGILQGPDTDPATAERLRTALENGGHFDGEILNYRRDGSTFWNALTISPMCDESGRTTGFFGIQRDITERKVAAAQLEASHATLSLLINSIPAYVSLVDADEVYRLVNRRYEDYFGRPAAEIVGRRVRDLQPPATYAEMEPHIRTALAGQTVNYRSNLTAPGGRSHWFDVQYVPRRDERGAVSGFFVLVFDISERMQGELRLRESEERFRRLIEHAPEAIVLFDTATGRFSEANPAAERLFQLSAEELCKIGPRELSPPTQPDGRDSGEKAAEFIARSLAGEMPVFEWTHRDSKGRDIICEVRLLQIKIGDRAVIRGSMTDITARKRLELEREQYRRFFQLSAEPMCIADPFGCFREVNPAFVRLTGYSEQELISKPYMDFILPEDRERTKEEMKLQVEVRPSLQFENRYVRKDGTVLLLSWTAIFDRNDGVTYATARDITALRQAEVALQEARNRVAITASQVPGMIYQYCMRADGSVCLPYASDAIRELFRLTPEEVRDDAAKVFTTIHPEDVEALTASIEKSQCELTPWRHEFRVKFEDGTVRWLFGNSIPRREADGSTVWHGFVTDVTERRQSEIERNRLDRKVQETQKLESLGVLAGGIAHDFNNLLTSVLGNASIAAMELPRGSPVHECLDQITEASLRAAELCKQMLAYSGRGRFVVEKIDLGELVEQTAQMLQISISKKAVLRFRLEKGLPPVEVDTTQVRQVIMNLVINASEAIGDRSGVISLSTGLTRIDRAYLAGTHTDVDLPDGEYVFLEVSDTGCGMSPETRAKIFDPFFTTKFTGRGLGLAAVLGIVRGHKGALKVYSEPGRGTTFKMLFPAAKGEATVAEGAPAVLREWRGTGTVLVVDDEETVRSTSARMLKNLGFTPVLVSDGREAVAEFSAHPDLFKLVLLDLTMPHLDGEQTFTELRRIRPNVRVVLMSGFNSQEALLRFTGKGLAHFLQKPFTVTALRSVLEEVLG